jgi:hypothetical protein
VALDSTSIALHFITRTDDAVHGISLFYLQAAAVWFTALDSTFVNCHCSIVRTCYAVHNISLGSNVRALCCCVHVL